MPDILHRVGIDAKPERVFAVLTTIRRRARLVAKQGDRQRARRRTNFGSLACYIQRVKSPVIYCLWQDAIVTPCADFSLT
jgi:hypothetical protein